MPSIGSHNPYHKIPRHQGGQDTYANLQLVHYYCHQQIHSSQKKSILKEEYRFGSFMACLSRVHL
ncbi:HNH endonuclease [Nostoc sp. FACHB-190]|uniref:HNH endonuclease n=1 Tax=Nostoc sp. FACHB-190 TaxID=2692838 RepID=UPI001F557154|nr:HNH endonuclease [Nostoc sp. FACHB-190]